MDSDDSESDPDQLTSSRTESSNQLDMKLKHSEYPKPSSETNLTLVVPDFIYHGAQSSTSSDISPMSEQKSLPRRGRSRYYNTKNLYQNEKLDHSRWLQQGRGSTRQMLPHLSVAETAFSERLPEQNTPDRPELSEAECDIDTLKKLKLGLRSSLWSRPSGSGQPSDYSIAV